MTLKVALPETRPSPSSRAQELRRFLGETPGANIKKDCSFFREPGDFTVAVGRFQVQDVQKMQSRASDVTYPEGRFMGSGFWQTHVHPVSLCIFVAMNHYIK